jgi:putative two-component system response regulator
MRVLVVDDDDIDLELLANTVDRAGYEVEIAHDGWQALEILRAGSFRLVISDWEMPGMSGIELCRRIRSRHSAGYVYMILVTARDGADNIAAGLNAGADDFITKPFEPTELCVRMRAGERILALDTRDITIFCLAKLVESRDPDTGAHLERIREYCRVIAQHLSGQSRFCEQVDGQFVETIYLTSPLHDIGKVGLPDSVLLKPGRLTEEEFEIMKKHTIIGAETLTLALRKRPETGFLRMARDIALTHHERFDGSGYPTGLAGEDIPLCGRIVALADVYDALTTKRVYKPACSHEAAVSVILEESGAHFDPAIVDSFIAADEQFSAIQQRFASAASSAPECPLTADSCI